MKRYILKISVEKPTSYIQHKRDVVSVLPKEEVIKYFEKQYENHKKTGRVGIKIEMEFDCGDIYEIF